MTIQQKTYSVSLSDTEPGRRDETLISDMTCAVPGSAWALDGTVFSPLPEAPAGKWRIVDYRCKAYSGRMLTTACADAVPLRIPLHRSGWHAVSIGIAARIFPSAIEVRFGPDGQWQTLFAKSSCEEPWVFADLTGRDLEIRYPRNMHTLPWYPHRMWENGFIANLMSVRLTPVRDEHLPIVTTKRHRRMVYTNDGHGIFWNAAQPGKHIVADALAKFAHSDWDVCCFGSGCADNVNFGSEVGTLLSEGGWDYARRNDGRLGLILREMINGGIDPMKQAVDTAHANGQEFWVYSRPQGWVQPWPHDHAFRSQFYTEHPQWRCVEADGQCIAQMSIAYKEVRRQLNEVLREIVERGADGVCIALVRGWPLVRYEEPVRERFRALYGRDARSVPDTDPALLLVWREFVTQWFTELRAMLDAAGPKPTGPRRKIAIICGANLEWNMRHGVDVVDLAGRKLLDAVLPYPHTLNKNCTHPSSEIEIEQYVHALADTEVELMPSLGYYFDHDMGLAQYRRLAWAFYRSGATGLSRWDAAGYLAHVGLNDDKLNELWCEHYMPLQDITLTELNGLPLGPIPIVGG